MAHQQSQSWALQTPEASFKALEIISITVKADEYQAVFLLTLQTSTAVAMGCAEKAVHSLLSHTEPFALAAVVPGVIIPLITGKRSSQQPCMKPPQDALCAAGKLASSLVVA